MLQETKCATEDMDKLLPSCWKQGKGIYTKATGTVGGFALLSNPNSVTLEKDFTTKWSISTTYRLIGSNKPDYLTNVYGPTTSRDNQAFLRNLENLTTLTRGNRWIMGRDFNMIRNLDEKRGGTRRLEVESKDFQNLVDNLGLIDTDTSNGIFTWTNQRTGSRRIACRLDQFLLSDSLMLEGIALKTRILDVHGSDHWPIQLWLDIPATPGRKSFRLERFWLNHPDFQQKSHTGWREATVPYSSKMMYRFQQKLKNFKQRLKTWNKHTFDNIFEAQK